MTEELMKLAEEQIKQDLKNVKIKALKLTIIKRRELKKSHEERMADLDKEVEYITNSEDLQRLERITDSCNIPF